MQCTGTRRGWKSPTSGPAHVHPAADDPNHGRGQRESALEPSLPSGSGCNIWAGKSEKGLESSTALGWNGLVLQAWGKGRKDNLSGNSSMEHPHRVKVQLTWTQGQQRKNGTWTLFPQTRALESEV